MPIHADGQVRGRPLRAGRWTPTRIAGVVFVLLGLVATTVSILALILS